MTTLACMIFLIFVKLGILVWTVIILRNTGREVGGQNKWQIAFRPENTTLGSMVRFCSCL